MLLRRSWHASPTNQLRNELDQFFVNFLGNPVAGGLDAFPPVNVWEEQDTLYVEAEVAGVAKDNLDITVVENELILKGQCAEPAAASDSKTYHRRERPVGSFTRVVALPFDVNADGVKASFNDGVLLVTLPKAEAAKPRKVKIHAS
ncbi:MAG TPA: Hsp20/alpha crystallin family protein [Pirellulales bacterium]|jgi:HSP20 family protein|nr:Hsp20/alpha crystallin family protein [Pirellulales bacterium]